ncbi:protein Wnt-16 [Gadus macrocephalus]|uniref:protein Wnt-16 n=1 Tax=Gadus macrocephalus TaxID=80720 RepID=UPI0028CBBC9E|nr:protein Wnt-16 [Gadus macrocephalus]
MERVHHTCTLHLLLLTVFPLCCQASWMWLGLSSAGVAEQRGCSDLPFSREQKELCRKRPFILPAVQAGARLGLAECQSQFKHERWNCTISKDFSVFGYELTSGTKESAFIHAVMAAGLVHAITRACSQGAIAECGCDASLQGPGSPQGNLQGPGSSAGLQDPGSPPGNLQGLGSPSRNLKGRGSTTGNLPSLGSTMGNLQSLGSTAGSLPSLGSTMGNLQSLGSTAGNLPSLGSPLEGWHWGGCSDHTRFATWFSRQFLDGPPGNTSLPRATSPALLAVNQHNTDAGRQAVERTMVTDCRCHGVSGSCAVKTCWRSLAPFERVGAVLKERFENSVEVLQRFARQKVRRKDKVSRRVPLERDRLLYLDKSPNYCLEDPGRGSLGTRGRTCSRTSRGADGCGLLCCGRGYNTRVVRHVTRCACKFVWCCYVRCRRCESVTDIHTCK